MHATMQHDQLPPLVEAVPEIRHSYAAPAQIQYSRLPYGSTHGSSQFPEARSLAPSPLLASRGRPQSSTRSLSSHASQVSRPDCPQYTAQLVPKGSSIYSDPNRTCANYSATEPLPALRSRSPVLLPAPRLRGSNGTPSIDQYENGSLPPIYGNAASAPSRNGASYQQAYHDSYFQQRRSSPPPRHILHSPYNSHYRHDYNYVTGQYSDRSPFSNGSNGNYLSFDSMSEPIDGKQKRRRGNLPKTVTDTLRVWFTEHIAHPYPTEEEKQILMSQTGLTISQISNWFINARRRSLPQMTKQAQAEAEIRDNQGGLHSATNLRA